ncbi:MAG: type II toxin-antitoxin system RelE/ParE family toxin [Bacteroidota bacterium]
MVKRKIIWSLNAERELFETLEYYIERNKSAKYSKKLYSKIKVLVSGLVEHPFLGKPFASDKIRGIITENYLIIYKLSNKHIEILLFWDCRRDPEILEKRLKMYKAPEI